MEEMNQKVEGIRRLLEELRREKYAVVNAVTAGLDDYRKELYLKFLCTVVQYENTPTEVQLLYLKQLFSGMETDSTVQDCMRRALELSDTDVSEFLDGVSHTDAGYCFALEGTVLAALGDTPEPAFEYLAELIELLDVSKQDLEVLCLVAKSVVRQDVRLFDEAKAKMDLPLKRLNYLTYVKQYYAGAAVDTEEELYYTSPDNQTSYGIDFPSEYQAKRVTFDRLSLVIDRDWEFRSCEKITFQNCRLEGSDGRLIIDAADTVVFQNCTFRNFKNRVAELSEVVDFISDRCEYIECGYRCYGDRRGGIVYEGKLPENAAITLTGNKLLGCYIVSTATSGHWGVSGVFWGSAMPDSGRLLRATVKDNEFHNCRCVNNTRSDYTPAVIGHLDASEIEISGNRCAGEVTIVLENEEILTTRK